MIGVATILALNNTTRLASFRGAGHSSAQPDVSSTTSRQVAKMAALRRAGWSEDDILKEVKAS